MEHEKEKKNGNMQMVVGGEVGQNQMVN